MKRILLFLFTATALWYGCKKADPDALVNPGGPAKLLPFMVRPVANFNPVPSSGRIPLQVSLQNSSSQFAKEFRWYLVANGTRQLISTERAPSYTFTNPGQDTIWLVAKNSEGTLDSAFRVVQVEGLVPKLTSIFVDSLDFTNPSTGNPWNGTDGANLRCDIVLGGQVVSDAGNLTGALGWGWSAVPTSGSTYPVLSLTAANPGFPKKFGRPTSIINFKLPQAAATYSLNFYQVTTGQPDLLVNSIPFNTVDYLSLTPPPTSVTLRAPDQKMKIRLNIAW